MKTPRLAWSFNLAPTLLFACVLGCGDDTGPGASGGTGGEGASTTGGGGSGGGGGEGGAGGGGGGGSGAGGSGGGAVGSDNRVLITVLNRIPSPGDPERLGFFIDNTGALPGEDCHIQVDGPCLVTQCTVDPEPTSGVDLGHLELAVGGEVQLSYDANASGVYDDGTPMPGSWNTGQSVAVSGTDGDVEDFNFEFDGPPTIPLLTPDLDGGAVSRAAPLSLTWEPTALAEVFAARLYTQVDDGVPDNYVLLSAYCTFPAADGNGTIPSSTLDRFDNGLVGLLFGGGARESIPGPEHTIEIYAYKADGVDFTLTD